MNNIPTSTTLNYSKEKNSIVKRFIIFFITAIIISVIIFTIIFVKIYKIHGTSMYPTLKEGTYVFCLKSSNIERGDIIAFTGENGFVIKRIVGLPGETIDIREDGTIIINNTKLNENYIPNNAKGTIEIDLPHTIPPNSYFVLGDNRGDSLDSRSHSVGDLYIDEIICEIHSDILKK
jgi:signal peptidase I